MPSERMHGLALPKPLSLERFVALIMSPLGVSRSPYFNKTDMHPTDMSSDSESDKSHESMCNYPLTEVSTYNPGKPDAGIARPDKSEGDLFSRANTLFNERESVTHRFDCNTVGPVPVVSGYGSRTLTHSAAYVLEGNTYNTSSLSSKCEKRHIQNGDNDLRELSETKVGVPTTPETYSRPTRGSDAEMVEAFESGTMPKSCHFTLELVS